MRRYTVWVVFTGHGEAKEKHGVYSRKSFADNHAYDSDLSRLNAYVSCFEFDKKEDLEDMVEDNLTEEQMLEYLSHEAVYT